MLFLTVQFRFRFKTFQKFGFRFGSGLVAPKFKGSGSVRVHQNQIFKVQVRFRFTEKKRLLPVRGSGSSSLQNL